MTESNDNHLSERLKDLSKRAKTVRIEAGLEPNPAKGRDNAPRDKAGLGTRVATELVVGTCVGTAIGYGFDEWLDTTPLGMIVGLSLGFAGSILTIYRVVKGYDEAVGLGRATRGKTDEE